MASNPSKMLKVEGMMQSDGEIDCAAIDVLNDDCLLHVINFLHNPRDLITVEKVCKRWRRIVSSQMAWKTVKIEEPDSNYFLEEILKKCGDRVIDLSVGSQRSFYKGNPLEIVCKYCKKLRYLGISFPGFFNSEVLNTLNIPVMKNFKFKYLDLYDLEHWDIGGNEDECLKKILLFLQDSENLKELSLGDAFGNNVSIKYSGKKIKISNFDPRSEIFQQIINLYPELENLKIGFDQYNFQDFSLSDSLNQISNRLTALELIDMRPGRFNGAGLETLQSNYLKKLVIIECPEVTFDTLSILFRNCPALEEIYLCDNEKLSDIGHKNLATLANLKKLSFGLTEINVSTLVFLAQFCNKLQEIYCLNLQGPIASELIRILNYLPNLKLLRIKNFKDFTKESVKTISHIILQRKNKAYFNIEFIDGTREEAEQLGLTEKKSSSSDPRNGLTITVLSLETEKDRGNFEHWKLWLIYLNKKCIHRRINPRWCRYYTLI